MEFSWWITVNVFQSWIYSFILGRNILGWSFGSPGSQASDLWMVYRKNGAPVRSMTREPLPIATNFVAQNEVDSSRIIVTARYFMVYLNQLSNIWGGPSCIVKFRSYLELGIPISKCLIMFVRCQHLTAEMVPKKDWKRLNDNWIYHHFEYFKFGFYQLLIVSNSFYLFDLLGLYFAIVQWIGSEIDAGNHVLSFSMKSLAVSRFNQSTTGGFLK